MSFLYGNSFAMPQAPLYIQTQPSQMPSQLSTPSYQQSNDAFYLDISRQLAAVAASSSTSTIRRRHSRPSQSSAMRVVKPSSASNSPTSSIVRKRMPPSATMASRPARPVSWHPSSNQNYLMPPQYFNNTSTATTTPLLVDDMVYSTYSNQTSPSTAFSPYISSYEMPAHQPHAQYYSPNPWALSPSTLPVPNGAAMFGKLPSPDCPPLINLPPSLDADAETEQDRIYRQQQEQCRQQVALHNMQMNMSMNANSNMAAHVPSFDTASSASSEYAYAIRAPRTPPMCTLNSEPAAVEVVSVSETAEDEADGEILVGMGLYDPPSKSFESFESFESFDNFASMQSYRSSVAQLLGASYDIPSAMATPTGKGLKLEDSWEPPENMDDEDEDDDERDAEGDDSN